MIISNSLSPVLNTESSPLYPFHSHIDVKGFVVQKVIDWGFPSSVIRYTTEIMNEWYSGNTLYDVLGLWETKKTPSSCQQSSLKVLTYNVQGWETRALEVLESIFLTDSSICIITEVGELWNKGSIPHFNTFYQKSTNNKGEVIVAVGKQLKSKTS